MDMKKLSYLLLFLLIFTACDDHQQVEDYSISLSEDKITTDYTGITQTIKVQSNDDNWNILSSSIPEWCNIEKKKSSTYNVEITISPNHTFQSREATITFIYEDKSCSLYISQEGIQNKSSLDWHTFPVNSFSSVEYDSENNNTERNYRISANEIYINSSIKDKIYHGNLIQKKLNGISGVKETTQYSYNPITTSAFVNGKFYSRESVYPSFENTNGLYDEVKSKTPTQNISFSYQTSPIQYNSYKHLNLLGVGNLGLKLDEIITGKSYTQNELKNRTGLIYSYCNILFNTTMDLPANLIKETIPENEKKELSYISNINYGKMAFLIVETDYDYKTSTLVIGKIMKGLPLTEDEEKVKSSINANYLFFNKDGNINTTKGIDVISMFVSEIKDQPIIPLSFSINTYNNNSVGDFELTFKMF